MKDTELENKEGEGSGKRGLKNGWGRWREEGGVGKVLIERKL